VIGLTRGENPTMSPEEAVALALESLGPRDPVVVAVSGGADSMALMHLLARAERGSGARIVVAHLDHGMRGEDSAADAHLVREAARAAGLPCVIGRIDPGTAPRGEARARRARYRFLAETARDRDAGVVFTAHTLDDQAETVLDRLLRGTGVRGLRGILPDRPLDPRGTIRLRRPLLGVRRSGLRAWLRERDLSWRTDPTNRDGSNRRSRIRMDLLPPVEAIGPGGIEALARVARHARETWRFIRGEARRRESRARRSVDGEVRLLRRALRAAPAAVRWPMIARWLRSVGQNPRGLGETAIREAVRIALEAPARTRFDRPGRCGFEVTRESLRPRSPGRGS
jgi:tRNA(Ile)-lysidine synthase